MTAQRVASPASRLVVSSVRRSAQARPFQRYVFRTTECAPAGCCGDSVPDTVNRRPAATRFCARGALSTGFGSLVGLHQCSGCGRVTGPAFGGNPFTSDDAG